MTEERKIEVRDANERTETEEQVAQPGERAERKAPVHAQGQDRDPEDSDSDTESDELPENHVTGTSRRARAGKPTPAARERFPSASRSSIPPAQRTAVKQRPHQETGRSQSRRASPWYITTGERWAVQVATRCGRLLQRLVGRRSQKRAESVQHVASVQRTRFELARRELAPGLDGKSVEGDEVRLVWVTLRSWPVL
jgi:hypothetical protein